jgi:hypothetical protein
MFVNGSLLVVSCCRFIDDATNNYLITTNKIQKLILTNVN